jgi:hypothetical protein
MMKDKVNFYFSMLIMLIAGVLAMWLIVRLATKDSTPPPAVKGSEASYLKLQESILNP